MKTTAPRHDPVARRSGALACGLALAVALLLPACGGQGADAPQESEEPVPARSTLRPAVGLAQLAQGGSAPGPASETDSAQLVQGAQLSREGLEAAEKRALNSDQEKSPESVSLSALAFLAPGKTAPMSAYASGAVASAAAVRLPAYRFYNPRTGAHFYTTDETERATITSSLSPPFAFEGVAFHVADVAAPGLSPVHRFYNRHTGVHFFTISEAERENVVTTLPQFTYEGVAYFASQVGGAGLAPLHRFYLPGKGIHFYTASAEEKATIEGRQAARYEGVAYHVLASDWGAVLARGTVVDDRAIPLEGAKVTVVSGSSRLGTDISAQTDADGRFALTLDGATRAVLRFDKAGYASGFKAASAVADNAAVAARVVLMPVASTQTFDHTQAAVLRVPGSSARVELAASSLVREDGQAISGSTTVALTPIDPSADIARMPGLLVDAASGEPIESLGALTIEFTDASGAPLNLASGQTATIRIPATPAAGATLPATFPLYHLNETTGRWTQEGTATLQTDPATGAKYCEGTVSHFSTWNADQVMTSTGLDLNATQEGTACTKPTGLRVVAQGMDYNGVSFASGNLLLVRENSQVQVRLLDLNGGVLDALEMTSGAAGATLRLPRCLIEPPLVTLSGRVTVSSGVLSNHRVQVSGDRVQTITLPISGEGTYATRVYANRGEVRARLVGQDRGTPDTHVTTTVAALDASFPNLTVQDTRFELQGCVQGWANYRQTSVQVSLFRGATRIGQPQTLQGSNSSFTLTDAPFNSTLTLRLTAPDATLAEKSTTLVVGSTPITLGSCLNLPLAAAAYLQVRGSGLTRSFDASGSTAGDAPITAYAWDFGDGSTASAAAASRSFAATGSYVVSLRVTDALGQVSLVRRTVEVTAGGTLSTLTPARALDAGSNHICAVRSDGVWCWGSNSVDQKLGGPITFTENPGSESPNTNGMRSSGVPLQILGLSNVTAVSASEGHSCALSADGTVQCWGNGENGQLGQGSRVDSATPVPVSGLTTAVAVSAGGFSSCALLQSGSVSCWGNSNTSIDNLVPAPVAGLSGVTALSAGRGHYCAVLSDGSVRCWGNNDDGQLGNGSSTDSVSPVVVSGISSAVSVVAGDRHSCALLADGTLRCWGYRGISLTFGGSVRSGLMGDGGTGFAPALTPVTVSGISTAVAIAAGSRHNCALLADATVWCWGGAASARGQSVATDVALAPVEVPMNGPVNALALGQGFTCVSLAAGGVQCLGVGSEGQLGTGGQLSFGDNGASPYPDASLTPLNVLFP